MGHIEGDWTLLRGDTTPSKPSTARFAPLLQRSLGSESARVAPSDGLQAQFRAFFPEAHVRSGHRRTLLAREGLVPLFRETNTVLHRILVVARKSTR